MGRLGTTELILILVVALVIFGPKKLPELGKMIGKAVRSARTYISGNESEWEEGQGPAAAAEPAVAEPIVVTVPAAEPVETAPDAAPITATADDDAPLAAASEESVASPVADAAVAEEQVTEAAPAEKVAEEVNA